MAYSSHYDYLNANLKEFFDKLGICYTKDIPYTQAQCESLVVAHGDKSYGDKELFEKNGVPFYHGVAMYLLTQIRPYNNDVRSTANGWVAPSKWVIENYPKFKEFLPKI